MASALPHLQGLNAHRYPPPDAATQATLGIQGTLTHLGDGAFKSVYSCRFNGTDAVVSVEALGQAQAAEAAVQARLASQPRHPHVNTALRGPVNAAGRSYTVLPRLQAEIFDAVVEAGYASEHTHFTQILSGLRHMHRLGVAHLDIKLENIMLSQGNEACLIDFNLSDVVPPDGSTLSTELKGSPNYAAPEVMVNYPFGRPGPYDMFKADVWSLGVVLFAMSAGYFPFDTATPADPRFQVLQAAQQLNQCIVAALFNYYAQDRQDNPQNYVRLTALMNNADLVALLNQMLRINPAARMTLDDVCRSPWVAPELQPATSTVAGGGSSSSVDPDTLTAPSTLAVPPAPPAFRSLGASSPAADSVPAAPAFRSLAASSSVDVNFDDVLAAIPCVGPPPITRQKAHLGAA